MKLDELKRLVEAATPGPWDHAEYKCKCCHYVDAAESEDLMYVSNGLSCLKPQDAAFIAAARNHISKLIAVAEAAKAEHHEKCPGHKNFCRCTTGSILRDAIAALEGDG